MAKERTSEEIVYEAILQRYEAEWRRSENLDGKASNIIGIVGVVASLVATMGGFLLRESQIVSSFEFRITLKELAEALPIALFFLDMLCFLVSLALGLMAYRTREYTNVPNPFVLIAKYADKKTSLVREVLQSTYAEAIEDNMKLNDKKVRLIERSFNFLFAGIVILFIFSLALVLL